MNYDRKITISVGASRRSMNWQPVTLMLSEFYEKLRLPQRTDESYAEYLALSQTKDGQAKQAQIKDIGGFVGGRLNGFRRKANAVIGRDLLTLDLDNIPSGITDSVLSKIAALNCNCCVYSTRKHCSNTPRLRVLLPLDRTVTPEEYEPLARHMADRIGIRYADPTTFEPERFMYWPGCSKDSEYVYRVFDAPLLVADAELASTGDWRDMSLWPQVPGEEKKVQKHADKQADPTSKQGVVGAFNRAYDIYGAIATFLPDKYTGVGDSATPARFTYTGGSTYGGAVVYGNGKFLYSNHATDPCHGILVNAFDLVRIHKFKDLDEGVKEDTRSNRLPSFLKMSEFAVQDDAVKIQLAEDLAASVQEDFGALADQASGGITENANSASSAQSQVQAQGWKKQLEFEKSGELKATIDNIWIIMENDPLLAGKFALNEFSGRGEVLDVTPWDPDFKERREWRDTDNSGLYWFFEMTYKITCTGKIDHALALHSQKHKFHEIKAYLESLEPWDGIPRLETLYIDYLGADDSPYVRAVTRKAHVAAVARVMTPGCKYDTMPILVGPQGIGKSTLLCKLTKNRKNWYSDSITTFEGKEASELIQGVWLNEIGELNAFSKSDMNRIKQFLTIRSDRYRAAYGRNVEEHPRGGVFFGTTNKESFLRDRTGNRRFWPVRCDPSKSKKSIWKELDNEVDQLWAEALTRWRIGESLHLIGELEKAAQFVQESYREVSGYEETIKAFLEQPVPDDWEERNLTERLAWLDLRDVGDARAKFSADGIELNLVLRDRVCAREIWCEAMRGLVKEFDQLKAREINDVMQNMPGWKSVRCEFKPYGHQRGFRRAEE